MKVDWSRKRLSAEPTLVKIWSTSPISACSAGTKEPTCASMDIKAFCRRNVLFPAMFGPVISHIRSFSPIRQSLLTKALPCSSKPKVTVGCLPPIILWFRLRLMTGRTNFCSSARIAKEQPMSSSSSTAAFRRSLTRFRTTCSRSCWKTRCSSARMRCFA